MPRRGTERRGGECRASPRCATVAPRRTARVAAPTCAASLGRTATPRATTTTVLLVEDDHDVREALGEALAGEGLSVLASDEGRKALELAEVARPSLILLDLRMSGMSGWEFLEKRRSVPALARTPVVVMTGAPEPLPDADVVLQKPFGVEELLQVVRRLLGRR